MKRFLFLLSLGFSSVALAQTEPAPVEQGSAFSPPPLLAEASVDNPAQLEVKLSTIEDELRRLRGKNEENEFQIKKLTETIEKLQRDIDMRFSDIGKPSAAAHHDASPAKPALADKAKQPAAETPASAATTAGDGVLRPPVQDSVGEFATPRDLYNHAFRLLNQTKYEEAARAFDEFTRKYPKDPLVGNAYYWTGETYYIRRDYVAAADNFRQGFEALPNGPKAADNLLKLAMSLDALNRGKEACVVLQQITTKYKKGSTSITEKAEAEQKRIGCK